MQASFVQQLNCYSFKFHTEIKSGKKRKKKQQWITSETLRRARCNRTTCCPHLNAPSVTSLGLYGQYIQSDSLPVL